MRLSSIRSLLLIAVAAALLVGLAGCTPRTSEAPGEPAETKTELVLAVGGEPSDGGFDPTHGWGRYGSPLFQSTLLTRDNDLEIVADLAADYGVSDDGLTFTFTLREAKFSDGLDVTAEDVAFTYETAAASGSVVDLTMMESVKAIDPSTVEFTLKHPSSVFLFRTTEVGIVPKASYGLDYGTNPIGSGPFQLVQWDKGQQMIVEPNPHYYGDKPAFAKLTFLFLEEDAAFAAAKAGQVDVAAVPAAFGKQDVGGMSLVALESVDNRGIGFPMQPAGGETEDGYAKGNDVTSDRSIRQAINFALDRQALVDGPLNGFGSPAYSPADGLPWGSDDARIDDADAEAAKQLLAEGGWVDSDNDGVLEKDGLKAAFRLIYPASDSLRQALALAVADQIRPIGIDIEVVGKSWDEITTLKHSNAVLWGWGSHDPTEIDMLYNSKWAGVEWSNSVLYSNPIVDGYLNSAMSAPTEEAAIPHLRKAAWDGTTGYSAKGDAVYAWLVNIDHLYLVANGLDMGDQRVQPHGHGWPVTANIAEWTWSGK